MSPAGNINAAVQPLNGLLGFFFFEPLTVFFSVRDINFLFELLSEDQCHTTVDSILLVSLKIPCFSTAQRLVGLQRHSVKCIQYPVVYISVYAK